MAFALTIKLLALLLPMIALPLAVNALPALTVTGALAVTAAAKVVAALTTSICELVVPIAVLPEVLSVFNSVAPDTARVPVELGMAMLPDTVARPELSMVRRSTS